MTVVTGAPKDVGLQLDPSRVVFASPVLRESTDGASLITTKVVTAYPDPDTGVVSAEVDPGVCVITYKGHTYTVTIPATEGIDLWNLIAAAIPPLPTTPDVVIAAAVEAYLEENPPVGGGGGGPVDIDDVVGLTAVLNAKADEPVTVGDVTGLSTALTGKQDTSGRGAVNGYAPLDGSALVPSINLPSYVDDVIEAANVGALPATGVTGKIYVTLDTNKTYRWSGPGSVYVEVSPGPGSTDSVVEGSANLYYTPTRVDGRIAAATGVSVQPYDATTTSYTSAEKTKLAGVASGAEVNVNADWNAVSGDALILNKPSLGGSGDVTLTGTQTLTNKTIGDKLDITTVAQPATPAAGTARLYARIGVSGVESIAYLNTLGIPIVLGRDICAFVKNTSGATITKGSVVAINSASGSIPLVIKAQADSGMTKIPAAGIMVADIVNNAVGLMMMTGTINNVDTTAVGAGNTLYVSPTTAGAFTATRPAHPQVIQPVGECLNSNATTGAILVNVNEINVGLVDGTNQTSWSIGDGTTAAARTLLFKNSNTGTLTWTPTATRTITLPDATGTVYLSGGTDVPITDGGTGVSTLPTGLLVGAGTGAITAATAPTGTIVGTTDTQTLSGKTLTNPTITNYTESVVAIGNTSTAKTIALTNGTVQTATLTGNCTFTMPTATAGKSFVLYLYTGAGSFTATFTSVKWSGSVAPTITTTAARMDILNFVADGASWYGTFSQNYTP